MLNTRKALTGSRVYGSGTTSPNRGQVSAAGAQGYLQREMRKPGNIGVYGGVSTKGADGQSDTRSGVAAQALRRQKGMNPNKMQAGRRPPPGQNPANTPTGPSGQPQTGPLDPNSPPVQQPGLIVNDAGQLELPYNAAWSQDLLDNLTDYNEQLVGLLNSDQLANLEYTKAKAKAGREYEQLKLDTLNSNAAGGTAFSSQYGTAVAKNANEYTNYMNDLDASNAAQRAASEAARNSIYEAFKRQLQRGALDLGTDLQDDAGTGLSGGGEGGDGRGDDGSKPGGNMQGKPYNPRGGPRAVGKPYKPNQPQFSDPRPAGNPNSRRRRKRK